MNANHYPSLDRCKKLTELGFPKTEHCYAKWGKGLIILTDESRRHFGRQYECDCPSVMEMIDTIPKSQKLTLMTSLECDGFKSCNVNALWENFFGYEFKAFPSEPSDVLIPNALADLIVWLVENSHITFDKR